MSVDIGLILSKVGRSSERLLLGQLLPSASPASLQSYLGSLLARSDQVGKLLSASAVAESEW